MRENDVQGKRRVNVSEAICFNHFEQIDLQAFTFLYCRISAYSTGYVSLMQRELSNI